MNNRKRRAKKGKPKKLLPGGGTGRGQQGPALPTPLRPLAPREGTGFMWFWQAGLELRTEPKHIAVDFIQKNKGLIHN